MLADRSRRRSRRPDGPASIASIPVIEPEQPTTRDLFRGSLGRLTLGICLVMSITAFEVLGSATAMPAALDDLGGISFYGLALSAQLVTALAAIPYGGRP